MTISKNLAFDWLIFYIRLFHTISNLNESEYNQKVIETVNDRELKHFNARFDALKSINN